MTKVSVIIPVFNEADNIDHLVYELNTFFQQETRYDTEVIFVNDGSADETMDKLKRAPHLSYTYKIISFSRNFGSHAALRAGILRANGDYITFMYADLQDPLTLVSQLYDEMESKAVDITWAFRNTTEVA
ncbi:MAG: glycosyltransferase, partial [Pontibacter sp.]|nr:glycosyltransferase [Pontibacter sp.]